jgi:hypothetical protein
LNTSGTISYDDTKLNEYDNTKSNVDPSGNLTIVGGTSQWTITELENMCIV